MARRPHVPGDQHGSGTLVALYAILLGFFIVINAQSKPEKAREAAVMDSLRRSFVARFSIGAGNGDGGPIAGDPAEVQAMRMFAAAFERKDHPEYWPDRLELKLPVRAMFAPGEARLRADKVAALAAVADQLAATPFHGIEWVLDGAPADGLGLVRLQGLAEMLEDMGLPRHRIALGMGHGDGNSIRLRLAPTERR